MRYLLTLSSMKTVQEFSAENGASGKDRIVDTQQKEVTINAADKEVLARSIERSVKVFVEARTTIDWENYRSWPDDNGRFTASCVEDGVCNLIDEPSTYHKTMYLADYDVRLDCIPLGETIEIGNLGRKSVDE